MDKQQAARKLQQDLLKQKDFQTRDSLKDYLADLSTVSEYIGKLMCMLTMVEKDTNTQAKYEEQIKEKEKHREQIKANIAKITKGIK